MSEIYKGVPDLENATAIFKDGCIVQVFPYIGECLWMEKIVFFFGF